MKAKLIIAGEEFEVDISEEQARKLTERKLTGFERTGVGRDYYPLEVNSGTTDSFIDDHIPFDTVHYEEGRYFNNKKLRDDYLRAIKLFLRLSQWQALHDAPVSPVHCAEIMLDTDGTIKTSSGFTSHYFGAVRFSCKESATAAINLFYDELEWYFKEFKPRLDMGGA